jgi:hypothetical protein
VIAHLYCSISGLVVFTDANYNPAEIPTNSNSQNILAETIANEADFLISYATVPGYASFRCPINGTFLLFLCWILELLDSVIFLAFQFIDLPLTREVIAHFVDISHFSQGSWRVNYQPLQSRLVACKLSATLIEASGV